MAARKIADLSAHPSDRLMIFNRLPVSDASRVNAFYLFTGFLLLLHRDIHLNRDKLFGRILPGCGLFSPLGRERDGAVDGIINCNDQSCTPNETHHPYRHRRHRGPHPPWIPPHRRRGHPLPHARGHPVDTPARLTRSRGHRPRGGVP